ncbi:MAG: Ig-like domain-containing protein [Candidatus Parcubacteria bacterium]|nr:Ig-like domain-containing protein [Candidatus Parcubacteria bacterium]
MDYSWVNGLYSTDNVCFSTNPALVGTLPAIIEDVYIDGGSGAPGPLGSPDCIPGNGGVDVVLKDVSINGLSSASYANGTGVFEYKDHNVVPGVPGTGNGHWDATEGLWYGVRGNNFALSDDPIISGPAPIYGYTPLTRFDASTGPTGQPLIYADADSSGTLTASDTILEDNGNVQTGLAGVPNGVIDREADIMNHLSFQNSGTANNTYISLDLYDAGVNGVCDNPVGSVDDNFLVNIPWIGSEWALAGNGVAFTSGVRNCISINISPFAGLTDLGKTFILEMPQLVDNNANGLYNAGDEGWFFYSGNDGPTGASVIAPYTLTIIADTVPPTVTSATTGDADHDGKIDILTVVYNEPVNDANYDAVAVTGYALLGTGSGTGTTTLVYNLTEGGVFDTDAVPALTWTGANAQDLAGNLLNTAGAPANAADGAEPIIVSTAPVSGSTDAKLDAHIIIIFSEPINPGGLSGSAPVPPPLGIAWSAGNTVLTVTHGNFTNGTAYTMAVTTAPDLAGNPLVAGPVANPWTFTTLIPSYGSRAQDLTPPGPLTNVKIKADSSGTITLTWQDPTDTDLNNIVIDELSAGQTNTQNVNKGVQTLTLSNRKVGQEYKYTLRAQDTSGNLSPKQIYSITVPSAGETVITQPATGEVLPSPLQPQVILPTGIKIGDLLKNPTAKTVYVVGNEGKRHVFPNEPTFFTWFKDFSLIKTVSNDILSQIPLDSNVTVRPGAKLVKIQTDPNIYAVEPGGIIRAIKSEGIARDLYGTSWAKRVLDLPDVFFVNYVKGPDITTANYPTGSLIQYQGSSGVYYIDNLFKKLVTAEIFANNLFRDEFVIKNVATAKVYSASENLPRSSIVDMMMLK